MRNKILMTLALLLTAVTGAWAEEKMVTINSSTTSSGAVTATGFYIFENYLYVNTNTATITTSEGVITKLVIKKGDLYGGGFTEANVGVTPGTITYGSDEITVTDINAESVTLSRKETDNWSTSSVDVYYGEPTEWPLTPNAEKKVWTLAKMPASDIELQVEYYPESNIYLSKDAKGVLEVKNEGETLAFDDNGKSTTTVSETNKVTATYTGTKKVLGMTVAKAAGNTYLKWDADQKKLVATEIPAEATKAESSTNDYDEWAGTYVVEGDVTIREIGLSGNVELIIKDGAKLTVNNMIWGSTSYKLSIYGQTNKTGQLVVNCSNNNAICDITTLEVHSCQVTATSSGGGCGCFSDIDTFNVYGGSVDAEYTSLNGGYGIGLAINGSMNIYGGDVKAVGKKEDNYGITGSSSTVTVYGGKLYAECADNKALGGINLTKGAGFSGKIEYSMDNSTWSETKDTEAKYVKVGY